MKPIKEVYLIQVDNGEQYEDNISYVLKDHVYSCLAQATAALKILQIPEEYEPSISAEEYTGFYEWESACTYEQYLIDERKEFEESSKDSYEIITYQLQPEV